MWYKKKGNREKRVKTELGDSVVAIVIRHYGLDFIPDLYHVVSLILGHMLRANPICIQV